MSLNLTKNIFLCCSFLQNLIKKSREVGDSDKAKESKRKVTKEADEKQMRQKKSKGDKPTPLRMLGGQCRKGNVMEDPICNPHSYPLKTMLKKLPIILSCGE